MTAPRGGPSQATQAAIEAETDENTYPPPDLLVNGPWACKCWVRIESSGTTATSDFNVSTIIDTGTGDRTINFTTAFSSSVYAAVTGPGSDQDDTADEGLTTFAVRSVKDTPYGSGALQDHPHSTVIFGDR
ncbi:hypothetical protein FIM07_01770 [SAR202 cluster bacterium AD-802-F09_MRT_200m]|nr:hypothetical protein [SAR202 cluster bacterium AD-802-F09_MRT_200m]